MHQKVLPHPTVRTPSASNSPSALSERALSACALRTRVGQEILLILLFLHYLCVKSFDDWKTLQTPAAHKSPQLH